MNNFDRDEIINIFGENIRYVYLKLYTELLSLDNYSSLWIMGKRFGRHCNIQYRRLYRQGYINGKSP